MTKGSEDYSRGKHLPSPVTPASTVCFKITIPDAVQYRAALFGVISQLSQWYTWDHPTDGTTCEDCEEAAQLWAKAISEAYFDEDCGGAMSCEDVADCIETDEAVQAALATQIALNTPDNSDIYNTSYYGTPMTPAAANANLTGGAGCDLNSLFGSVTAIVDQLNRNNIAFLNRLEITSNTIERIEQLIAAIPAFETLPVDDIVGFADVMLEQIKENYEATYTDSYRDEIRCGLFCLARDNPDCEVSFEMIQSYYEDRLGTSFDPNQLFTNMVTYFTNGFWTGTQIIDMMTLVQVVVWKVASNWIGLRLRTLQLVGALGANDDDPDWELLCEDCPPPPDPVCQDLTETRGIWNYSPNADFGEWTIGQGWHGRAASGTQFNLGTDLVPGGGLIGRIKLTFNQSINGMIIYSGFTSWTQTVGGNEIDISEAEYPDLFPVNIETTTIGLTRGGNTVPSSLRLIESCFYEAE